MEVVPSTEADVVEVGSLSLEQSRTLPVVLGVLLAVAGLGVLVHVQYVVSRGRRRELAVLRTLGFRGTQVAGAVAIQAVVLVVLAFLIGAPIGLLVGRWAWTATADRLGVKAESVLPWTGLIIALAVSVALAALASVVPAYQAARRPAAEVLRSE
jgi:putative ABC transport system permease protein